MMCSGDWQGPEFWVMERTEDAVAPDGAKILGLWNRHDGWAKD